MRELRIQERSDFTDVGRQAPVMRRLYEQEDVIRHSCGLASKRHLSVSEEMTCGSASKHGPGINVAKYLFGLQN